MVSKCLVKDCNRKPWARGFCGAHYQAFRSGRDLGVEPIRQRRLNGEGSIDGAGYRAISSNGVHKREHQMVVEKVLGREIKWPEQVHHVNGDRADNRNENLVLCPNYAYHQLLHQRQKALTACGNPEWRKCKFCGQYSPTELMHYRSSTFYHRACENLATKARRDNDEYRERRKAAYKSRKSQEQKL